MSKKFYPGDRVQHLNSGKTYTVEKSLPNGGIKVIGFPHPYTTNYMKLVSAGATRDIEEKKDAICDRFQDARARARDVKSSWEASIYVSNGVNISASLDRPMVALTLEAYENLCNAAPEPLDPKVKLIKTVPQGTVLAYTNDQGSNVTAAKTLHPQHGKTWKVMTVAPNGVAHLHSWDDDILLFDMEGVDVNDIGIDKRHAVKEDSIV